MRSAHRTYIVVNWRGPSNWTFPRCLRLALAEISGQRDLIVFAAVEDAVHRLLEQQGDA